MSAASSTNSSDDSVMRLRRVVIKFGGSSLSGDGDLKRFGMDVAVLMSHGIQPVIVHGGGPEISQEMERRGLKVSKVQGLRITDDDALKVAVEVLSKINSHIVEALIDAGVKCRGLSAAQDMTVLCTKMPPVTVRDENGHIKEIDLGNVGEVCAVNPALLESLFDSHAVPVVFPICCDLSGKQMNVNADTVAAYIARAIGAEEMVLVTDVPGLMTDINDSRTIIHELSLRRVDELISAGMIKDGMIPKVEACRVALMSGVKMAYMICGKDRHAIVEKLVEGKVVGTRISVE